MKIGVRLDGTENKNKLNSIYKFYSIFLFSISTYYILHLLMPGPVEDLKP